MQFIVGHESAPPIDALMRFEGPISEDEALRPEQIIDFRGALSLSGIVESPRAWTAFVQDGPELVRALFMEDATAFLDTGTYVDQGVRFPGSVEDVRTVTVNGRYIGAGSILDIVSKDGEDLE